MHFKILYIVYSNVALFTKARFQLRTIGIGYIRVTLNIKNPRIFQQLPQFEHIVRFFKITYTRKWNIVNSFLSPPPSDPKFILKSIMIVFAMLGWKSIAILSEYKKYFNAYFNKMNNLKIVTNGRLVESFWCKWKLAL